eukprot:scaffold35251_cov63-Cyclotella_meneghiniana.AAC.2
MAGNLVLIPTLWYKFYVRAHIRPIRPGNTPTNPNPNPNPNPNVGITTTDTTFFYTAYTGSAASAFGGRTIVKASGMWSKGVSEEQRNDWRNCKILVIDEISFMKESELMQLDNKLKILGDRNKIFGGYSIIFGGDFRPTDKG